MVTRNSKRLKDASVFVASIKSSEKVGSSLQDSLALSTTSSTAQMHIACSQNSASDSAQCEYTHMPEFVEADIYSFDSTDESSFRVMRELPTVVHD